jgi:hypothetical protein
LAEGLGRTEFSEEELVWLAGYRAHPTPLSVGHPDWRGIRSSASQLFDQLYFLQDDLDESSGRHYARLFAEAGCPAVVIQGFPKTFRFLVSALEAVVPSIPVYLIWHGNFMQAQQDYAWAAFQLVVQLAREGKIAKLGFVKKGMAEVVAAHGLPTGFVMNRVRQIPLAPSRPLPDGPHFGIWNIIESWQKPPFAMIAAVSTIPGAVLHSSAVGPRVQEALEFWQVERGQLIDGPIDREDMPARLASMHVNLNVTLSECAPMVPLESLSLGVPSLLGPTSHYFEDHDYLHSRLVVPSPDSAWKISKFIERALEERTEIVEAYRAYAPGYNERAAAALEAFLGMPAGRND